jgi:hypothetical protein
MRAKAEDESVLLILGLAAGVGQVAEERQDRGRRTGLHAGSSWEWIGDGPSPGRRVADPSIPEIPLAPLGQLT